MREEVKMEASPGAPYNKKASTNAELFDRYFTSVRDLVVGRVRLLRSLDHDKVCRMTALDLIAEGLCDPIRVFIKNEPHSVAKMAVGKLRIISSVSIVDQLVERVLNENLNKFEITNWDKLPAKPGMGLDDASITTLWENLGSEKLASTDMSNWDWSVSGYELMLDGLIRSELMEASAAHRNAIMNRTRALAMSSFVMGDGVLLLPQQAGIQKSGSYNTSSTNSRVRIVAAYAIGAGKCFAMGDDAVETIVPNAQYKYELLGHNCKDYAVYECGFEFCSHKFEGGKAWPVHPEKSLYRVAVKWGSTKEQRDEALRDYDFIMRHHPQRAYYNALAAASVGLPTLAD